MRRGEEREAAKERMTASRAGRNEEERLEVRVEGRRRKSAKKADMYVYPVDGLRSGQILEGSFKVKVTSSARTAGPSTTDSASAA